MSLHPKATHFTTFEGGIWYAWVELTMPLRGIVHSVKFEDGSIWDSLIGWREPTNDPSSKINLPRT